MRLTKNDMARVIVLALYNLRELPAADHFRVVRMARAPKSHLERQHALAMEVIQQRLENNEKPSMKFRQWS